MKILWRWLKAIWKDAVGSKVISVGVITVISGASAYAWWTPIFDAYGTLVAWLHLPIYVERWKYIGLLICGAILLVGLAFICWTILRSTKAPLQFKDYNEDRFHGLRWRWRLDSTDRIRDLVPLCDTCLSEVRVQGSSYGTYTVMACPHCTRCSDAMRGDANEVLSEVEIQIRRKLRSGEWVEAVHTINKKSPP